VTVYERDDRPGGLLRYGIPDFKLEKALVDRRAAQLAAEGVEFAFGVNVGAGVPLDELRARHDAIVLATGAQRHRALTLPGAGLGGVHRAMDYLVQQNRRVAGLPVAGPEISARGLRVAILGGGDTSADCLGNVLREGCAAVVEIAHGPTPPTQRSPQKTWPEWPFLMRTYPAHEEGGEREWQLATYALEGDAGRVQRLLARRVEFPGFAETGVRRPVETEEVVLEVDLVLVAIGFTGVDTDDPLYAQLGCEIGPRATVPVDGSFATGSDGLYAAGDCVRGADLIVQAIADGREVARSVDLALQGASALPSRVAV
jgi:glutamate synthase (NADPH/NADH) small chain